MKKLYLLSALLILACSTDSEGNPCIYEPTLTTEAATDITEASATLNGVISIVSENCDVPNNTEQGFVYSTEIQPTLEDTQVNVNGTNISTTIEDLEPNTTYYVRAFLTNNFGDFYGDEVSFTTTGDRLLLLKTQEVKVNGITIERWEFSYDDENRLIQTVNSVDNGNDEKYVNFYTENLRTSSEWYLNDVLEYSNQYIYNNSGKIISTTRIDSSGKIYRSDCVYNSDGTFTFFFREDGSLVNINIYTILNDQLVNVEGVLPDGISYASVSYTYDDKNHPSKNEEGLLFPIKNINNVIKEEFDNINETDISHTYTYNEDNYPLTKSSSDSPNSITEYTYY